MAKLLSGLYKSLDLFPAQKKKKIFLINILSRGLECSSVVEHLPSKNKTLGSLMPQGEKIRKKMTDLSLTSRH